MIILPIKIAFTAFAIAMAAKLIYDSTKEVTGREIVTLLLACLVGHAVAFVSILVALWSVK